MPPEDLMELLRRLVADANRYGRAGEICGELLRQFDPRGGEAA